MLMIYLTTLSGTEDYIAMNVRMISEYELNTNGCGRESFGANLR
jgi:hypothetical protein